MLLYETCWSRKNRERFKIYIPPENKSDSRLGMSSWISGCNGREVTEDEEDELCDNDRLSGFLAPVRVNGGAVWGRPGGALTGPATVIRRCLAIFPLGLEDVDGATAERIRFLGRIGWNWSVFFEIASTASCICDAVLCRKEGNPRVG